MRDLINIFAVAFGYAAAIIGAGFASGQEIVSFFVRYGKFSIFGIIVACLIFFIFACAIMCSCIKYNICSYDGLVKLFYKSSRIQTAINISTLIFSICSICVMTACIGEICRFTGLCGKFAGSVAFSVLCLLILLMNGRKVLELNSFLGGIIILGIVFSCLYILRFREQQVFSNSTNIMISGFTYAGYNLLTTGAVLAGMSNMLKSKKDAVLAAAVSSLMLFIMILLIWGILQMYYGSIELGEIPMLTMTFRQNNILGIMYCAMLFLAVLTTGISNGFGAVDIMGKYTDRKLAAFLISVTAFCMSGAGFSQLINTLYRLCGYIGMAVVFSVIFIFLKNMKKVENKRIKAK